MKRYVCLVVALLGFAGLADAQQRVDRRHLRERVLLVVPMVGNGTFDDPRRPLFAPKPGERSPIEGYTYELSDDGQLAIVEFVAAHPDAFRQILADTRLTKAFRKGAHKKNDIEKEIRKIKKDFDLEKFAGGGQ